VSCAPAPTFVLPLWIAPGSGCVGSTPFEAEQPIANEGESVTCGSRDVCQ